MEEICLSECVLDLFDYETLIRASAVNKRWFSVCGNQRRRKRTLRLNGVSPERRFQYWIHEAGAAPKKIPYAIYEARLDDFNDEDGYNAEDELAAEILRDVTRTFPTHPCFSKTNGTGQTMLFNILKAIATRYPEVGYCQGMNFVVAVILLVAAGSRSKQQKQVPTAENSQFSYADINFDYLGARSQVKQILESEVFGLMCAFLENFDMKELWRPCVPQLKLRIYQFGRLLHRKLPDLEAHFSDIGVTPDFFASQWFLTLMSYNLPLDLVVRVWDVLVIDGWKTIFRVGISLLTTFKEDLMTVQ
mmetsp:Transcript_11115/g.14469  ORF Transcript_11115/g.14469 Transcript_11115/m.14469 type:complete len:304 (-) Transcript_11115:1541-2452(-)